MGILVTQLGWLAYDDNDAATADDVEVVSVEYGGYKGKIEWGMRYSLWSPEAKDLTEASAGLSNPDWHRRL